MKYAIVNRYKQITKGVLLTRVVYGPFDTQEDARAYNLENFPYPEYNDIVPLYDPKED